VQIIQSLTEEGATRNDWLLDSSLAVLGIALVQLPFLVGLIVLTQPMDLSDVIITGVTGTIIFLSITIRRHYPVVFFGIVNFVLVLQVILLAYPTIAWIVILLSVFDIARSLGPRTSVICLIVALAIVGVGAARWSTSELAASPDLRTIILLSAIAVIGAVTTVYSIGRRFHDVSQARTRQMSAEKDAADLQIAEQAAQHRNIEAQVRAKIARELHDIVAHSVAVMVIQAEGGLVQADHSPDRARQALVTISETGRESLQEMRHIVRMLRSDPDEVDNLASAPRVVDIPVLIEKAQATLTTSGTPHGLTPIIEMTVYRVIQEALTNSLKHAGPEAYPRVDLVWQPTQMSVEITNHATDYPRSDDHRGTGLIGMAERVQALDGTLTAGPVETGGFRVCAQIPLQPTRLDQS